MAKKKSVRPATATKGDKKINFYLVALPLFALLVKFIIMSNIVATVGFASMSLEGGWLAADGENYLNGVAGLVNNGFFSDASILSYWPAGYPILIWILAKISIAHTLWLVSIVQSTFYAYASYYFVKQLRDTRLKRYIFMIGFILAFNPTLSLSSLAVGYESPIAACMLMVVGLIIKAEKNRNDGKFWYRAAGVGAFFALASFMQPRWLLTTVLVAVIWALSHSTRKEQALIITVVVGVMAIAPVVLVARNINANQGAVISTNLGVTMRIGAGDETDGGYDHKGPEVPCNPVAPETSVSDNQIVKCVIKWYATHPVKAVKLFTNKSFYFWSPWSGPINNGTMARNPWLKINPLMDVATSSMQGNSIVFSFAGSAISWAWMLGCISLFFVGFFWLRSFGGLYSQIAWLTGLPVVASWLVGMGTIGDHRFRLPTMALSLFLQVLGYYGLKQKVSTRSFKVSTEA